MIVRIIAVVFLLLIGTNSVVAQVTHYLTLDIPQKTRMQTGESREISIGVTVRERHHVQANPASDKFLIPVTIKIKPMKDILLGAPIYPAGKPFILKGTTEPLSVYDGNFSILIPVKILPAAEPQEYTLEGEIRYQVCDDVRCFTPRSMPFTIPVNVVLQ